MKRIVLFVEGEGESGAVPILVKRLLTEQNAWDAVRLDPNPFRVGEVGKLAKKNYEKWNGFLKASLKRGNVGGVLLILDGDIKSVSGRPFCAAREAILLAKKALAAGGGATFSVAVVFARQEYESWLMAGLESRAGEALSDGRQILPPGTALPAGDLEEEPRNAKRALSKCIEGGYKPTRDQASLTDMLDIEAVRTRGLRSFRRLESALGELVSAIRNDDHVATPLEASADAQ